MSIIVQSPPKFSHVGNPVFLTVTADNPVNPANQTTILIDIYHNDQIIYTAAAPSAYGTQKINIAEILQTIVVTPLPFLPQSSPPSQMPLLSIITNWLSAYYLIVRQLNGATQIDTWTSDTLYAVPGSIDPELFLSLADQNTNIFQSRLFNSEANRFLTVYADTNDTTITFPNLGNPENPENLGNLGNLCLFFIATSSESLHIELIDTGVTHDFTFTQSALYCINLSILNFQPLRCTFSQSSNQSNPSISVEIQFETPPSSWNLREWLFLNHFGVFETFISTGRVQTSVTRPENTASRYIPALDAFHNIDLPSKPIETIKLPTGFTNARGMNLFRHFALSEQIYLIENIESIDLHRSNRLIYYIVKSSAPVIIHDDMRQPASADLELERSIRQAIFPVFGKEKQTYNLVLGSYNLILENFNLIKKQ